MFTGLSLPFYCCPVFIAIVNGTCFWIDGTEALNRFPCYDLNSVGASMCCDSKAAPAFDHCIHGICVYNLSSGVQGPFDDGQSFWRDSCTDPRWKDPACLAMAPYNKSSEAHMSRCFDGSFCPRTLKDPNMTCCDNGQGQYAQNLGAPLPDISSSTQSPASTSGLATASLAPPLSSFITSTISFSSSTSLSNVLTSDTSTKALPLSSSLSTAAEITTILGSIFGGLAVVAAVVFGIRSWRTRYDSKPGVSLTVRG